MKIGSLLLGTLLAMVVSISVLAEPEVARDPSVESLSADPALDPVASPSTATESVEVGDEAGTDPAASVAEPAAEPTESAESNVLEPVQEAPAAEPGPANSAEVVDRGDDIDDPEFQPGDWTPESSVVSVPGVEAASDIASASPIEIDGTTLVVGGVTLGPVGIDAEGRVGRIHTVTTGDTLWDVSKAYLGTAWVWPSVWNDNSGIQNPHLINPGDRLWISSTEIRRISDAEADEYLSGAKAGESINDGELEVATQLPDDFGSEEVDNFPAADDEFAEMAAMHEFEIDEMDQLPVGMHTGGDPGRETGRTVRVSMRENMGFVSDMQLQAATTILGSPSDRQHLSMLDTIYFGLGEGEVQVGDEFTFFRNVTDVRSPSTNDLIGYHVDVLGWAEVIEVTGETCVAVIRVSVDGTMIGDRVMPRYQPPADIAVKFPEEGIEGEVLFMPASRTLMGTSDYVFLDVGAVQGVEIGTDLEVYDPGYPVEDTARDQTVRTPDRLVADLVVVTVQEESAVAYIANTRREIAIGDAVRGATRHFPSAF